MWNTLRGMGVPEHLITLIRSLHKNQKDVVRTEHGRTERFEIGKGVRQGCILSPMLFNLYTEDVMRVALTEGEVEDEIGVRVGGRVVNNLQHADDTTLVAETEQGLKTLVERVVTAGEKVSFHLNLKKTKVMSNTEMKLFSLRLSHISICWVLS